MTQQYNQLPVLKAEAVHLRQLVPADVGDQYVAWMNDKQVNRYMETRFRQQERGDVVRYVENALANPRVHFFAMTVPAGDPGTGFHIGNIKLEVQGAECHRRAELSLWIGDKNRWGGGIASQAIALVRDYGFGLGMHKLTSGCYSVNPASGRAFEKAGFTREAVLKRHYLCEGQWVDRWVYCCFNPNEPQGGTPCAE